METERGKEMIVNVSASRITSWPVLPEPDDWHEPAKPLSMDFDCSVEPVSGKDPLSLIFNKEERKHVRLRPNASRTNWRKQKKELKKEFIPYLVNSPMVVESHGGFRVYSVPPNTVRIRKGGGKTVTYEIGFTGTTSVKSC